MSQTTKKRTFTLALTGASGAAYGLRLLQCLLAADNRVNLLISKAGQMVLAMESELSMSATIPARPADIQTFFTEHFNADPTQLTVYGREDWMAPIASGSGASDGMIVCPCTSGTLSAIAAGSSDNLIERAADVMIKEHKPLIIVLRETPLSVIHLENMLKLARLGVTIMPANPGFYQQPQHISDLVDFIVARILDHLSVSQDLIPRWGQAK